MKDVFDGRYYADGRSVYRQPKRNPGTGGLTMGFRVCDLADGVSEEGAQEIADALNAAEAKS